MSIHRSGIKEQKYILLRTGAVFVPVALQVTVQNSTIILYL